MDLYRRTISMYFSSLEKDCKHHSPFLSSPFSFFLFFLPLHYSFSHPFPLTCRRLAQMNFQKHHPHLYSVTRPSLTAHFLLTAALNYK